MRDILGPLRARRTLNQLCDSLDRERDDLMAGRIDDLVSRATRREQIAARLSEPVAEGEAELIAELRR
ncbi:MAG: hypothetical protein AAFW69_12095, partial [Pseudomonadota bacterium]